LHRKVRAEYVLAILFTIGVVAAGAGALYFFATMSIHSDAAAVRSTAAGVPPPQYARAVEDARQLARATVVTDNLPGLSVAIAHDGDIVWAEGFGWADIEQRTPVTPVSRFRIGNLGVVFAKAAVDILVDRGRLDLDAPVQKYVRAFGQKQWPVTTRDVIADHVAVDHRGMPNRHCATIDEAVQVFADDPLLFEPRTQTRYSMYSWVLASAVIEKAAGQPFFEFVNREVLTPLRMTHTSADGPAVPDRVSFYFPRMNMKTQLGYQAIGGSTDYSCYFAAGAFVSTPSDLVAFASHTLRKADTYHGSSSGGTSVLIVSPERALAVAVLSNESYAYGLEPIALKLADIFAWPK